jgi:uncharacterized protein
MSLHLSLLFTFLSACSNLFAQPAPVKKVKDSSLNNAFIITTYGKLYGTLELSDMADSGVIVLIIAGSGPTDRDGNSYTGLQTNAYLKLAELFKANGISSLRYDKRFSTPAFAMSESDLKFDDYVGDAVGWIKYLKHLKHYSKIILLGHSEGSLIAIKAANIEHVDAIISVDGAGEKIDSILLKQIRDNFSDSLYNEASEIIHNLSNGNITNNIPSALMPILRPSVQPFLISWMRIDPQKEIQNLQIPVLLLHGTKDLQVDISQAQKLKNASTTSQLQIINGMNHIMADIEGDTAENLATYTNPNWPLHQNLSEIMINFIKQIESTIK